MTHSATLSRDFTQIDPLPGMGSPYVYGNNNPMRYVDPAGLRATTVRLQFAGNTYEVPNGWILAYNHKDGGVYQGPSECFQRGFFNNLDDLVGAGCDSVGRAFRKTLNDTINPVAIAINSGRACGEGIRDGDKLKAAQGCIGIVANGVFSGKALGSAARGRPTVLSEQAPPITVPVKSTSPNFVAGPVGSEPPVPVSQGEWRRGLTRLGFRGHQLSRPARSTPCLTDRRCG